MKKILLIIIISLLFCSCTPSNRNDDFFSSGIYPAYDTLEEFAERTHEAEGLIARCNVVSKQNAMWTKNESRGDVITTDVVLELIPTQEGPEKSYIIVRTTGGSVGSDTLMTGDESGLDLFKKGGEYVILLTREVEAADAVDYYVNGEKITFTHYRYLMNPVTAVFDVGSQGDEAEIISNREYQVSYEELMSYVNY